MPADRVGAFAEDGFSGPFALFTSAECRRIADYLRRPDLPEPDTWAKGRAVNERYLYDLAIHPDLLRRLTAILGEDIVLWGVSAVRRAAGQSHPWHSDIESYASDGGFVSVWIGIEHTTRASALHLISRSHELGCSVQEARAQLGTNREDATLDELLRSAQSIDRTAELVVPEMADGDAILFDGRLWHGSHNRGPDDRTALLLQYAAAAEPVRIPDWSTLEWPLRLRDEPRPPVVVVCGHDRGGPNRVVPAPSLPVHDTIIESVVQGFALPLDERRPSTPWRRFPALRGRTPVCVDMACHASVLAGGHSPHPPHGHAEEELLIALHGAVELTIPSSPSDPGPRTELLDPGSLVYYPAWQLHTIRNPGTSPVAYLMFKWRGPRTGEREQLATEVVRSADVSPPEGARPFWTQPLLEGCTGCLDTLHVHLSVVQPGAGYAPHTDAHDVAIVTLEGAVQTLDQEVGPRSVVYCSAGEPHGLRAVGTERARYLAIEFHAPAVMPVAR